MNSSSEKNGVEAPAQVGAGWRPWVPAMWFAALLLAGYAKVLLRLSQDWINDDNMGHGFFVPVVAAYILWLNRDELFRLELKPHWLGLALFAAGFAQLAAATLGIELFLARTAFLISLIGAVLWLGGWTLLKAASFPIFLLLFMIPIPAIIFNQITFPLQIFASQVAETILNLIGIPVLREGNILELPSQRLSVVEACSGIRSLLSLSFLALVYGSLFDKKAWMKWALLVVTIPIAVIANATRVTVTGILSEVSPETSKGFFHFAEGWLVFMVALACLIACHYLINFGWRLIHGGR